MDLNRGSLAIVLACGASLIVAFSVLALVAGIWPGVLGGWGPAANLAEFLGLGLTICGFVYAAFQISRLKEALTRVNTRLALSEIGRAARLAQDLQALVRHCNWTRAIDRCEELRPLLASLVAHSALSEEERMSLSSSADDIRDLQARCEQGERDASSDPLPTRTRERLSRIVDVLAGFDTRLKDVKMELN